VVKIPQSHHRAASVGGPRLCRTSIGQNRNWSGRSPKWKTPPTHVAEEKKADSLLTRIAADGMNMQANQEVGKD